MLAQKLLEHQRVHPRREPGVKDDQPASTCAFGRELTAIRKRKAREAEQCAAVSQDSTLRGVPRVAHRGHDEIGIDHGRNYCIVVIEIERAEVRDVLRPAARTDNIEAGRSQRGNAAAPERPLSPYQERLRLLNVVYLHRWREPRPPFRGCQAKSAVANRPRRRMSWN